MIADQRIGVKVWMAAAVVCGSLPLQAQVSLGFNTYAIPTSGSEPIGIVTGPDGALWFTEYVGNKIGRISTGGTITEFPIPTSGSSTAFIAVGPDNAIWFTEFNGNNIGRITTSGTITEFALSASSNPGGIAAGSDGALWFSEYGTGKIGRITTAGTITEYPIPTTGGSPYGLAAGPDGALWFTEYSGNKIGRITTAGTVTEYTVPTPNAVPYRIAAGADGALWFTESTGGKIGHITTSGTITEFTVPTANPGLYGISLGPDGAMWFAESSVNKIARISLAGVITEFGGPAGVSSPFGIAGGPDGGVWFTGFGSNTVSRAAIPLPTSPFLSGMSPNSAAPGSPSITLTIDGTGFQSAATAFWNGTPLSIAFLSATQVNATVPATLLANPGFAYVTVSNPGASPNPTNALLFTITGAPQVSITEYSVPTANAQPDGMAVGSDGALWFTELLGTAPYKIGRISTAGSITEFPIPSGSGPSNLITAGPDGALWFTEPTPNKIGRITTAGVVTGFTIPTASSTPIGITAGPDGALWFAENTGNKIGRITTSGAFTEFTVPTSGAGPWVVTSGPDGALWFTENSAGKIGRVTTSGSFTEFTIPTSASSPTFITTGPDGALWFAEIGGGKIGRITTSGTFTEYPVGGSQPICITLGPDGALWFTEYSGNQIGRITTAGAITLYPVATPSSLPNGIISGPDGALWFAEQGADKIGRAAIPPAPMTISSDWPNSAVAGTSSAFTMYVYGSGFQTANVVSWDGTPLATTFVNGTELVVSSVPTNLVASAGFAYVQVTNPDGTFSNAVPFTITTTPLTPVISTAGATYWTSGNGYDFSGADVTGTGFQAGLTINWNGTPTTAYFLFQPPAVVSQGPPSLLTAGPVTITAQNPGGAVSNALNFIYPQITISGISPSTVEAGSPSFTLNVTGSGFQLGDSVVIIGSNTPTTFVSSTQLQATIPASTIANAGSQFLFVLRSGNLGAGNAFAFYVSNQVTLTSVASGPATSVVATGGTPQTASVNTQFAVPLQATVEDASGNPVAGVTVTFSAPSTGATGVFGGSVNTVVTDPGGRASVTFIANGTPGSYTVTASAPGLSSARFTLTNQSPQGLSIAKSHSGNFVLGQQNATFTITVTNVGSSPTSGTVTVSEAPPSGMTLVSMSGTGWTCPASGTTCTRSDSLAGGRAYQAITVTVNVAASAASQLINQATVSGGGSPNATASDTVIIASSCTFTLTPTSTNVGAGASAGSVAVATGPNCSWSVPASSLPGWISIGSGSGTGPGTITYGVAANGGAARSGSFTLVDANNNFAALFTVNQAANTTCTSVTLSPTSAIFSAAGTGTGTATVTLNPSTCGWSSISVTPPSATWVSGFPTGPGTGQFTYTVAANPSTTSARSATLNVVSNNQTLHVTITENALTCTFTIANSVTDTGTSAGYLSSGGSGSIVVNASPSSCTWTWMSTQAFVTPSSGSGSGNGSIQYGVASNSNATAQTAFIALTGQGQTQPLYYAINEAGNVSQSYTAAISTATPSLRSDGLAELTGDILINSQGTTTTSGVNGDVVVTFNTPVTNHALSTDPSGQTTDALLLVNEPSSLSVGINAFRGMVAGPNAIRFAGIPLAPAAATDGGSFATTLRITNARVDASHLGSAHAVTATINFVAPVSFSFSGSSVTSTSAAATVGNVVNDAINFTTGSSSVGPGAGQITYPVTFKETLTNSYRARVLANQDPSQLGIPYNSESGFVNTAALGGETGFATNGTRLVLTVSNVPPGVTALYASLEATSATSGAAAQLVSADANGVGGFAIETAITFGNIAYRQIPISNGTGTAVWEVTSITGTQLDSLTFNVLTQGAALPGNAFSAFIGPKQQVSAPSLTAPVPRFLGNAAAAAAANLSLVPQGNILSPTFSKVRFTPAFNPDGSPTTGGSFSILETLTNNGSSTTGIRVGGSLDPTTNATFTGCVADTGGNCSTNMNDASITFPSLAAGQSVNINLNAFVPDVAANPYVTVTSTVYSDQPNIGPSTFTEQIPVVNVGQPSLFINKVLGTASGCNAVSSGTLAQGQQSAVYTLTVCNQPGAGHTSGQITVTEFPDGNQTLVSMQGSGWTCNASLGTCITTAVLNQGSLPPIAVNVNVSPTSASNAMNRAYVVGGGSVYVSSSVVNSPVIQGLPLVVSGTPAVATASPQVFTITGRDSGGFANIAKIFFLVAGSPTASPNTCQGYYDNSLGKFFLFDNNNNLLGPLTAGGLSNSQCSLSAITTGVASASGTDLAVNFNLSLLGSYLLSNHNVYVYVTNDQGIGSGWVQTGTWGLGPSVVSGVPTGPTTTPQTFTFVGRDTGGYQNIGQMYFLINTVGAVGPTMCQGFYDQTSNTFWLYGDPPQSGPRPLLGPLSPGSAQTLQNSECTLYGAPVNTSHAPPPTGASGSATVSGLGTDLTISLTLGLQGAFAAVPENVYLWVQNLQGQNTNWVQTGTWTIGHVPSVVSGTPAVAAATPQVFTFVGRDTGGYGNISQMSFLVSGSPVPGANRCWGYYARATNGLYLYDDTGVTLLGPIAPGSSGVLQNSQCVLYGSTSSLVSGSGTDLTVNIGLGVIGSYAASPKNVYLQVSDNESNSTAWVQTGTWNLVAMPSVVSGTPTNPTTTPQTFTFVGRDPGGYQNIQRLFFLINTSPMTTANVCHGYYDQPTNSFYLYNDALTVAMGPLAPGSPGTLQNSQCTLYGTVLNSSRSPFPGVASTTGAVSGLGTDLTVTATFALQGSYGTASQNVYVWVENLQGQNTGWVQTGTWSLGHTPSVVSGTPSAATVTPQTFTVTGRDTGGYGNIDKIYFLVNNVGQVGANTCHGYYDRASNSLYLYNDALTVAMGPLTPGSPGTLQNSQCVAFGTAFGLVSQQGTDVTINIGLGLLGAYTTSPQNVYFWVKDNEGSGTGWVQTGTWNVASVPLVVSSTPTNPTTTPVAFTFVGRDTGGYQNVSRIYFLVNSSPTTPLNTCQGFYDRPSNTLYLYNDANTVALGPLTPGSSGTLQNSQCTVFGSLSSANTGAGTDLSVGVGLGLQGAYALNAQNVYLWVTDSLSGTGWVKTGTWTVGHTPSVVSGTPATATATPQAFTFTGRDTGGFANITQMNFRVANASNSSQVSCQGYYLRSTNSLYLANGSGYLGPVTPGSAATLQTPACVLYAANSALVSATGTDLTVQIGLGLVTPGTPQNVALSVQDSEGSNTGYVVTGTWNIAPTPFVVSGTPTSPSTTPQIFAFTGRDTGGYQNIKRIFFLVNTSPISPPHICQGYYDQATNALYLYDDQSQTALGPLGLGSAGTLQNSQCVLYGASSALVPGAGTDLTIDVGIGLLGSYASTPQKVYLWVQNNQLLNTGWVQTGTWNIGHTPSVVSGTPASATANPQIFTFTGRDTGGWGNIDTMYFLINTSTTAAANTCQGYYVRSQNALYLYNDAQTVAQGPLTPGAGGTLSNSQCSINGSTSSLISTSGTDLTIGVSLGRQATGPYSHGAQNVYLFVKDNEGNTTGWVKTGTWTLP